MLFNRLVSENKTFPKTSKEWIDFLSASNFRLFGIEMNLWELDSVIIRLFNNFKKVYYFNNQTIY